MILHLHCDFSYHFLSEIAPRYSFDTNSTTRSTCTGPTPSTWHLIRRFRPTSEKTRDERSSINVHIQPSIEVAAFHYQPQMYSIHRERKKKMSPRMPGRRMVSARVYWLRGRLVLRDGSEVRCEGKEGVVLSQCGLLQKRPVRGVEAWVLSGLSVMKCPGSSRLAIHSVERRVCGVRRRCVCCPGARTRSCVCNIAPYFVLFYSVIFSRSYGARFVYQFAPKLLRCSSTGKGWFRNADVSSLEACSYAATIFASLVELLN